MKKNKGIFYHSEKILILFLIIFSLLINQYYGNKGVFPLDSFSHFDAGFRVLNGEYPFKDYWVTAGPFIDYLQAFFFHIIGINWQAYVLHASFVNALLSVATYFVLRSFQLNIYFSFFYSIIFSILAYPSSGTPFVDHHSAFFSLLGLYTLILAIKNEKTFYWIVFPILFGFAFLSKQVPSAYIILSAIFIVMLYVITNKKIHLLQYTLVSCIALIFLLILLLHLQEINFSSFLNQYIYYPMTIGENRFENLNFTFRRFVGHYKFIYLAALPFFYLSVKDILLNKNFYSKKNFYFFLILFSLIVSFITHQLLTKNQIFIFFLIPIFAAFSHIFLVKKNSNNNVLAIMLIIICTFSAVKYHLRFNEDRKFHELNNVNFDLAFDAKKIDKIFIGLKWISPQFRNNPDREKNLLTKIVSNLNSDERRKMVMTNYSFFSTVLDQNLYSPSRWYLNNGVAHPIEGLKYFKNYRTFFIKKIKENKIEVIYTVKPVNTWVFKGILSEKCLETSNLDTNVSIHLILECDDLK